MERSIAELGVDLLVADPAISILVKRLEEKIHNLGKGRLGRTREFELWERVDHLIFCEFAVAILIHCSEHVEHTGLLGDQERLESFQLGIRRGFVLDTF